MSKNRPSPVDPTNDGRNPSTIAEDHRRVRHLVSSLESVAHPDEFARLLHQLHDMLVPHFAAEEAPAGLLEEIRLGSPAHAHHADRLAREHVELLHTVRSLRDDPARPLAARHDLCSRLADHERLENELQSLVLYNDIGAAD